MQWCLPAPWYRMIGWTRRRRLRRRRREESAAVRVRAVLARVILVVLVAVAAGYAFYLALLRVAPEGTRRGVGG